MEKSWVVNIRFQCREANVPFFFKQWGGVHKSKAGRELDGRTYDEFPQVIRNRVPSPTVRKELATRFADIWPALAFPRSRQSA
jgi:hypothetical protein